MRRSWVLAAAIAVGLASPLALAGDVMVHVGHNKLDPAEVSIRVGDTVTFHNMDQMPGGHTVSSDDGKLKSPPLAKDEAWSHEFTAAGSYGFHIVEHPTAKAVVVVE